MNKFCGIGRLTADPDFNVTNSGVKVCRFTLAINRPYQQNGETQTDFLNIVVWRQSAENCVKYLEKGKQCAVVGSVQVRDYKDKDGNKRYVTEIVAEQVEFLGSKTESNIKSQNMQSKPKMQDLPELDDDSLPF